MRPCLFVIAAFATSLVVADLPAGGENFGIPVAPSTVPFDRCSVAAANDADMRLTAFAWGYNNAYWMAKQGEHYGSFGEWTSLGGFFSGGPTVLRNSNNDLVVFGRGADRKIYYKVLDKHTDAATSEWIAIPDEFMSPRITVTIDPQGLFHIFALGRDSSVYERRQFANGVEAIWGNWTSLGGKLTSDPAAIVDAEGITHLFARGVDGFLWSMTQQLEDDGSLTWVAWQKHADSVLLAANAHISAKLNVQNLIEVVVRGADKAFWHTRQTVNDERGVIWSPFKSLGGIFSSAPSLQLNSDGLLTIFGRGPDKGIWYKLQAHHPVDSPSDTWSRWVSLGGRFSAGFDVATDSRGYLNVFGRGLDKSLWTVRQSYSNHTVGFFSPLSDLHGRFRAFAC